MSENSKYIKCFFLVIFLLVSPFARAQTPQSSQGEGPGQARNLFGIKNALKDSTFRFFPVPVFETDPAAGQRYGVMPTFLWFDKDDQLFSIAVGAFTYNPQVVKFGGFAGVFLYPSPDESFRLFFQQSQDYEKDIYIQYVNESWLQKKLNVEIELEYYQNPFERFFGFGPQSSQADQTNFVSHTGFVKGVVSYEFWPKIRLQFEEKWTHMDLFPHAIFSIPSTETFFAGNSEVESSNILNHRFSVLSDTRDNDDFPTRGHYLEGFYLLGTNATNATNGFYQGYGVTAKQFFSQSERFITVAVFRLEKDFGDNIPFYMQPNLGGEMDLRAFVARRFTGKGRFLLDLEERIKVKRWNIHDVKFDFDVDPFFSVGQVFDRMGEIQMHTLQPVGGLGFRALAPPSVVGRVDIGYGTEGMQVYTALDYPF